MSKKSRKLIRSYEAPEVEPVVAALPEEAPRTFYFVSDATPEPVSEAELRTTMKQWRHGRATRTLGQALQDGYVALFSVVMLGAMVVNVILGAQGGAAACTTQACTSSRLLVPLAVAAGCWSLTLAVGRLFGPVLASAAEGFWLMDAPIRRAALLRGRLVAPVVITTLASVLVTGLAAMLVGQDWWAVAAWAMASGAGAAALIGLAAARQSAERPGQLRVIQACLTTITVVLTAMMVAIAAGWLPGFPAWQGTTFVAFGVAVVAAGLAVLLIVRALARLELLRRSRLVSGGSLVSGMQGAMFALDFGLIRDILVERRAAEKGFITPAKGRGTGLWALIWRDLERLWREPTQLIGLLVAVMVPYAADALRLGPLNPLVSGLALFVVMVPLLGSLRVLTRTGGLARSLPFKTSSIRTAAMAVPAVLMVFWALASWPAFIGIGADGPERDLVTAGMVALCTGLAGLFGAVRWVTAKKVDFGVPMLATESGAMPPTLLFNLVRGFDMVALITAPLILQAPVTLSLGIAGAIFVFLRGTFSMEELKADQESALRERDAAKAAAATRTKVPRPNR